MSTKKTRPGRTAGLFSLFLNAEALHRIGSITGIGNSDSESLIVRAEDVVPVPLRLHPHLHHELGGALLGKPEEVLAVATVGVREVLSAIHLLGPVIGPVSEVLLELQGGEPAARTLLIRQLKDLLSLLYLDLVALVGGSLGDRRCARRSALCGARSGR